MANASRFRRVLAAVYGGGHALLSRSHLDSHIGYYGCHVLGSRPHAVGTLAGWDAASLWMGEISAARSGWLAASDPAKADIFSRRWHQGHLCLAASIDGVCAAYIWAALGPSRFQSRLGEDWVLPAASAWVFDSWAHPLFPGTYPALKRFATERLLERGVEQFWGQVEFGNTTSMRVHRRLGASPQGWVFWFRFSGLRFQCLCASCQPGLHFTLRFARSARFPVPLAAFLAAPPALSKSAHKTGLN